jgi:hypothetical protein
MLVLVKFPVFWAGLSFFSCSQTVPYLSTVLWVISFLYSQAPVLMISVVSSTLFASLSVASCSVGELSFVWKRFRFFFLIFAFSCDEIQCAFFLKNWVFSFEELCGWL